MGTELKMIENLFRFWKYLVNPGKNLVQQKIVFAHNFCNFFSYEWRKPIQEKFELMKNQRCCELRVIFRLQTFGHYYCYWMVPVVPGDRGKAAIIWWLQTFGHYSCYWMLPAVPGHREKAAIIVWLHTSPRNLPVHTAHFRSRVLLTFGWINETGW